ncbi:hypothetical protein F5890DRAFT_1558635 [Lentinula detonsa]|uniref:PI3K/PI4K catalytic domain-containing protein n=1 Tax=Lentinula detonsa TaxID=2804962 RepID=A0AA38PQP7_9AGAR|nr:hypothetical protein F5890DRAFT_1558635 [Lentinula detonsa]
MAAYSVACCILQIKDRHNGNIMIDGEGHIVHIGPGGVKFKPSSFKLNHEMIVLMGGRYSQGYQLFQHLTVKARGILIVFDGLGGCLLTSSSPTR